jgi:protein-tyrosine-phosphatase
MLFERALRTNELDGSWIVGSAGTWAKPGLPVLPHVSDVAQTYGLDLNAHRSRRFSKGLLSEFNLVLVMEASQKEALQIEFPGYYEQIYLFSNVVERRQYDIPDLSDSLQGIREVSADLDGLIRHGFKNICVLATYVHNLIISAQVYDS